jgi:hypothetical protein
MNAENEEEELPPLTPDEEQALWLKIRSAPEWVRREELCAKNDEGTLTPEEEEELLEMTAIEYERGDVMGEFLAELEAVRAQEVKEGKRPKELGLRMVLRKPQTPEEKRAALQALDEDNRVAEPP